MGRIVLQLMEEKDAKEILDFIRNYSQDTYEHSVNVANYVEDMICGKTYSLCVKREIVKGALFHDIGKCLIPLDILEKPSRLTADEFALVKEHVHIDNIDMMNNQSAIVKQICAMHHEKINGTGYLAKSKKIPFYVQVVTVADIFEAMISKRSYKEPKTVQEACQYLRHEVANGALSRTVYELLQRTVIEQMTYAST